MDLSDGGGGGSVSGQRYSKKVNLGGMLTKSNRTFPHYATIQSKGCKGNA